MFAVDKELAYIKRFRFISFRYMARKVYKVSGMGFAMRIRLV